MLLADDKTGGLDIMIMRGDRYMPYAINHNQLDGIIEVTLNGAITGADLREAASKCIALGKDTNISSFLIDAFEVDVAPPLADIYNLPAKQFEDEQADRQSRTALILPKSEEARKAAEFCETACLNHGWTVKTFSDRQNGVDWLMPRN